MPSKKPEAPAAKTLDKATLDELTEELENRGWEWMFTRVHGGGLQVLVRVEPGYRIPKNKRRRR